MCEPILVAMKKKLDFEIVAVAVVLCLLAVLGIVAFFI